MSVEIISSRVLVAIFVISTTMGIHGIGGWAASRRRKPTMS